MYDVNKYKFRWIYEKMININKLLVLLLMYFDQFLNSSI